MPSIAFVHNNFPSGGAERITQDIADYLQKYDGSYTTYVYATAFNDSSPTDSIVRRTIPRKGKARSKEVERLILQDKIDILIQVTTNIKDTEGIRQRTGCKTILANHGEPFWQRYSIANRRQNSHVKKLMWRLFNKKRYIDKGLALEMATARSLKEYQECDAYTVLCESYRQKIASAFGIDAENSHIYAIENPEKPIKDIRWEKDKTIMFCGRLEHWSKRTDRLLRIWKSIQDELPEWNLVIVGDGPARKELELQAAADGLQRVKFAGARKDPSEFYRKASIVALTSQTEGWPLALTEAQAHGCIPVAFGCTDGVREILAPHGENGFIVTPFDEKEYAETLVWIAGMSDKEKMKIRKNAVAKRAAYSPEVTAAKWKRLFEHLINNKTN